jgi:flagellar biosynthetic protein FlhB
MADKSQQTEKATERRLTKAREEGNFLSARQFLGSVQLVAFIALLNTFGADWMQQIKLTLAMVLRTAAVSDVSREDMLRLAALLLWRILMPPMAAGAILMLITVAIQLGLTKMGMSAKKLAPDFTRLNPASRLKGMFSQNLASLAQAVIMLPLFGAAVYAMVEDNAGRFLGLPFTSLNNGVNVVFGSLSSILWKTSSIILVFGFVDLFRQQRRHSESLKMSKQEIRDEVKETEGNPQMKQRIRRIRRDLLRRRMMQNVPTASMVVTNPTHFAVAIRYEMDRMAAPVVVAKGKNFLAARIRQVARENQIPIVENPALAQALYKSVEVGQEIPINLYRAVAEVLAYIHRVMYGHTGARRTA